MALFKRGNTWWISLYHNGKRHRISTRTSDRKKAEEIHAKVLLRLSNPQPEPEPLKPTEPAESTMTYAEFYEKHYLPWCYGRQEFYQSKKYYLNIIPDWFKNLSLNRIGTKEVELLQSYFIQNKKTIATCNRYIAILQASMTKACDWNLISEKRLKNIRKVKLLKGETKRLKYLSKEEIDKLLSHCDRHLYPIVFTALHTGMRKGEILNSNGARLTSKTDSYCLRKLKTMNAGKFR